MPLRLSRLRHNKRTFLLILGLVLLVTGCSRLESAIPSTQVVRKHNPTYLRTVTLGENDTPEDVVARYGGKVVVWEPGEYALLGTEEVTLHAQASGTTARNDDVFYAGGEMTAYMSGRSRVWAGGRSRVWAGGKSRVWAGGSAGLWEQGAFAWMPENTAKWQQVRLQEAQLVAPNLGDGVKVAIIDTGIDLTHPALIEALAPASEWKDFYDGDALPQEVGSFEDEGYGHGTNVAGIVRQIAPKATILPIRVLGPDGGGNVADLTAAIQYAVNSGAKVINLSLGSEGSLFSAIDNAIKIANSKGAFVVASTGNTANSAVTYPAKNARNIEGLVTGANYLLSVASVGSNDVKSPFSTYASSVKLSAPGETVYGPAPDMTIAAWSGTSQAAPMVSGALALALGQKIKPLVSIPGQLMAQGMNLDKANGSYKGKLGTRLDIAAFVKSVVTY